MFKVVNTDRVRFLALLAKTGRMARDKLLGNVAENRLEFSELTPARGEHNPTAALGFEPLSPNSLQISALCDALASLDATGRAEIYTLMLIGQNQLAADKWNVGLTDAESLGDETVTGTILDDADLHDHLMKGLYECGVCF